MLIWGLQFGVAEIIWGLKFRVSKCATCGPKFGVDEITWGLNFKYVIAQAILLVSRFFFGTGQLIIRGFKKVV